jgi:hypothetical protein
MLAAFITLLAAVAVGLVVVQVGQAAVVQIMSMELLILAAVVVQEILMLLLTPQVLAAQE